MSIFFREGHHLFKGEKEFREAFSLYFPKMVAYAELLVGKADAFDIVQDVFLNLWEDKARLNIINMKSYLYKTTYNKCLNHIKHSKVKERFKTETERILKEFEIGMYDPDNNEVFKDLTNNDLGQRITSAIEELPQRCRQVFILSYINNLRNKEIGEVLQLSERTVESHIHNALKFLRIRLRE